MKSSITIHVNDKTGQWFYSTYHGQPGLSEDWVPVSYSKRIWDQAQVEFVNDRDLLIDNPNTKYQPKEVNA